MTPELEEKLQSCPNLPSPQTVAMPIIQLANEPESDFKQLIQVPSCDPALASKILRIANSPIYPHFFRMDLFHNLLNFKYYGNTNAILPNAAFLKLAMITNVTHPRRH